VDLVGVWLLVVLELYNDLVTFWCLGLCFVWLCVYHCSCDH
jgi:hypothetical protein